MLISFDDAIRYFSYDPDSGKIFYKLEARSGFHKSVVLHAAGEEAGCNRGDGRIVIRIQGRLYLRYRLAWLIFYGEWPSEEIDHINGVSSDDRIANLRSVSRKTNQENIRVASKTKKSSKILGVYLDKRKAFKKWRSAISINGRQISLGYFLTEEEAAAAYVAAKRIHHLGCTI